MKKLRDKFGKKGFTLVELTVVLVIIGILAAIGIPTAMHFIKKAEYRKNEENAKTAYLAAESTLTWYRSSGEWEAFREQVMANGVLNKTFPAGDEKEGRIYAVSVNNWNSNPSASHEEAMKLLDGGVYSKDFFNAEIVIELDVESGQVYSAFYGTRCNSLTYSEATADGERCISAAGNWREPDTRKEVVLGYYSVEDVTNVVELKQVRLKVTTINLINSETLSLNWTSNSRNDNLDVKYLITFYQKDEAGDEKLFTTEVELSELRGKLESVSEEDAGVSTKTGMVSLELKPANPGDTADSLGTWAFPLTYQQTAGSGGRFSLVLDGMMTAELAEVVEANKGTGTSVSDVTQKASTSITRLGAVVPALKSPQDIYAEILAQPSYREITGEDGTSITMNITEYKPSSPVRSNTENTLFAKAGMKTQTGENGAESTGLEAEITRFRHLSNIRYYNPDNTAVFTLASRNLDWTSTGVGMYGISWNETGEDGVAAGYGAVEWNSAAKGDEILDFPSIPLLGKDHKLEGKKGLTAQVANLHLGVGSMPNDVQIEKLYGADGADGTDTGKESHYLGLFCESEGQIEELTLLNPVLRLVGGNGEGNTGGSEDGTGSAGGTGGTDGAGDTAGALTGDIPEAVENFDALYGVGILCGRNQGSLKDIAIKTTSRDHQTVLVRLKDREEEISGTIGDAKKPAGIGGLVGVLAGKNADGSLKELTDADKITLSGLTTEGKVTGYLPSPEGGSGAVNPDGTGTGSTNPGGTAGVTAVSAEELAKDYTYGIGGMFGYAWIGKGSGNGSGVQLVKCTNYGDINGNLFTGGIVGSLKGGFATEAKSLVSIRDSINNGLVLCLVNYKEEDNRLEGRYFGGILGYGDRARIINCVNASQYREDFNDTKKDELLHGHYVGGIIGYGNNSQLSGCSTRKGSYVLGSDYVGGIAGGLSNVLQEAITGENNESAGVQITTNGGYIIGNRYVGGIVGKNDGPASTTVANCINNGVAAGYDRYIGGIVGYNGTNGIIKDCASYFSDYGGFIFQMIVDKWKAAGDCAGGLAGYNNGEVVFDSESQGIQVKSISSIVVGDNYVGGVIGFNDVDGTLDVAYTLIGGQIHGYGNAVGGCIGLNASEEILEKELAISPTSIKGNYHVGGCIGANVVNLTENKAMTQVKADNRLGSITGNAFTGGVIGYQRTYTEEQLEEELNDANPGWLGQAGGSGFSGNGLSSHDIFGKNGEILLLSYIEGIEDAGSEGDTPSEAEGNGKGTAGNLLPLLREDHVPTEVLTSKNERILTIGDRMNKEEGKQTEYNNIPVYSDLYTGGIVGYCERDSRMHIVNSRNSGNLSRRSQAQTQGDGVSLKAYLESRELDAEIKELEGEDLNLEISIGGGIIGANLENQIIDHCINTGTMSGFIGLGGIVGFNAGGVFNCQLSDNFGNPGLNYIGGIAGLNVHAGGAKEGAGGSRKTSTYTDVLDNPWNDFTSGTVARCSTQERRNISGRSYVGGIVGYNLSGAEMKSNENNANVTGAGSYVGGMAGANSGSILVAENSKTNPTEYTITGNNGEGIGGIVGWNRASGSIDVIGKDGGVEIVAVDTNVSITGKEKVGGIVGICQGSIAPKGDTIGKDCWLVCRAKSVLATDGYAGGIIGEAKGYGNAGTDAFETPELTRLINKSVSVKANQGPAGGIVAVNQRDVTLKECRNLGDVSSDMGYAGGIAAENYGSLIGCEVGDSKQNDVEISIHSKGVDEIGAVCAVNHGFILASMPITAEDAQKDAVTLSGMAKIVGGVAGRNAAGGQIGMSAVDGTAPESYNYQISYMPAVDIKNNALTIGGVVGLNQSGIVSAEEKQEGRIQNVDADNLEFINFTNYQYLGGIVGENQAGALVEDCIFENGTIRQDISGELGNCYGGIAGRNAGSIGNCKIRGIEVTVKGVYAAFGGTDTEEDKERISLCLGGIAGRNNESGIITGCQIEAEAADGTLAVNDFNIESGMAGGVVGFNEGIVELSGDRETQFLMEDAGNRVANVQDLISKAKERNIQADEMYVSWDENSHVENQQYANGVGLRDSRELTMIMSVNGNLGGIAAYNASTGQIAYCATGKWLLNNKSASIGVGTGGVIGMNESKKDLAFLLNRAFVGRQIGTGALDRFAGGIIGNQNNSSSGGWKIQNCINYGTVYCKNANYAGGILGQWTSSGGTVENCYNYGNLQTTWGDKLGAAGGIVAQLYHAYENHEYNIVGCGNYGNIYGRNGSDIGNCANDSAGILGNVTTYKASAIQNGQNFTINVLDCVNGAGVIVNSRSIAAGIVGFFSCDDPTYANGTIYLSTQNIKLNIERCRNYAKLNGQSHRGGILGERYGQTGAQNTTIKYCFSLNTTGYSNRPIVAYSSHGGQYVGYINNQEPGIFNYYISDQSVNSFQTNNVQHNTNAQLQRANALWVFRVEKDGLQYFIHLTPSNTRYVNMNDLEMTGDAYKDAVKYNGREVGHVLFTIPANESYPGMQKIMEKGSGFDKYVRKFCYEQEGLLLAPEKVILTRGEGDRADSFTVEIRGYDSENVEYIATLYRKYNDENGVEQEEIIEAGSNRIVLPESTVIEGDSFVFDTDTFTFEITEEVFGQGGELYVKVKARNKTDKIESTETSSNLVSIDNALPAPVIQVELVGSEGNYQYRFRLTNTDAYENKGYTNPKVYVKLMNENAPFSFEVTQTALHRITSNSLQQMLVWVEETNDNGQAEGMKSEEISVPVYLPAYVPQISVGGNGAAVPSASVSGGGLQNLSIRAEITRNATSIINTPPIYRAELIGDWTDEDGNIHQDTVFQSKDILTTASGSATAAFTNLPDYLGDADNIRVRLWYGQSGLGPVYTYYEAEGNGGNIHVLEAETETSADGTQTQVLSWKELFSPVLVDTNNTFKNYRWTSGPLFTWLKAPNLMQLNAGESLNPETNPQDGHLYYTFKWDEGVGENTPGEVYIVSLSGIVYDRDADGNIVNTRRVSIITDEEVNENKKTVDAETWTYEQVELTVSRKGDDTATPRTVGRSRTEIYAVRQRLPQPEQPRVTNADVNELEYTVEWNALTPETGCEFYEIYVQPYKDDGTLEEDPSQILKTEVLVNENGQPNAVNGIYTEIVDLERYTGKKVLVYLKAYPKADDITYVHSVDGITYELTVPERIDTPEINEWKKSWKHERYEPDSADPDNPDNPKNIDQTKSIEEFEEGGENGLKVTLTAKDGSIPPGGSSYLTKAYIFEEKAHAEAAQQALVDNNEAALEAALENLVAYYPLLNAENKLIPAGMEPEETSQNQFSHTLTGLSAEYAGKYILFSARISSGGGKVSSQWVVQQSTNTPNDFIWQLPYVKLPTPEVSVETGEQEVEMTFTINPDISTTSSASVDEPEETVNDDENSNIGNAGNAGNTGSIDEVVNGGNAGDTGNNENTGNSGTAGNTGNAGDTENTGNAGNTGDAGNPGTAGNTTGAGNSENTGNTGAINANGNGVAGNTGAGTETNSNEGNGGENNTDAAGNTENAGTDTGNTGNTNPMSSETANRGAAVRNISVINENVSGRRNGRMAAERMINSLASSEMIYRMGGMTGGDITFMATAVTTGEGPTSSAQPADNIVQPESTGQGQPSESTNPQPDGTSQGQPGGNTNLQPGSTGQDQPGDDTNSQPGNTNQGQPSESTNPQPDGTGQGQPGGSTNLQPGSTGQGQPGENTNLQPGSQDQPADSIQSATGTGTATDSGNLQTNGTELQDDGIAPQADAVQGQEIWTAENTVLTWSSVKYADAYYFTLTGKDEANGGSEIKAEFKIVETKDEDDPSVIPEATVYGKDTNGDWQVVETTGADLATGTAYTFDLSQAAASFQPYHKIVTGIYAVDSTTTIPYSVELKTSLKITMQDGVFTYTLSLPDSNRLNPPADSKYGQNSIVNSDSDKLRFTDMVSIWSDMAQNGDTVEANWSEAYVKSEEYLAEFNN